jgi:tRNA-intron endonuclease
MSQSPEIPELSEDDAKLLETGEYPSFKIPVKTIGNKCLVFYPVYGSLLYGYGRYFGSPVGIHKPKSHIFNRPLELTLFEVMYLLKHEIVEVFSEENSTIYTPETFYLFACAKYPEFAEKYVIYEDLREKKYIPRPGQKFGADFIVYKEGPGVDHSSFCIQVLSRLNKISSIDVVRAGRLATSVKKRFVLANPITKSYFQFRWFKP